MVAAPASASASRHFHAPPQQAPSKDGTVDSGAVEQLLSEKLVQGYLLLEKACPCCATPLVKKQQQQLQQGTATSTPANMNIAHAMSLASSVESNNIYGKGDKTVVLPIPGVPFCVWCQAHVVTDESEVRELETVSSRLKVRGTIMVAGAAGMAKSRSDDDDDDDEDDATEQDYDDFDSRDDRDRGATYTHLATLDLTTPKPYDEKSNFQAAKSLKDSSKSDSHGSKNVSSPRSASMTTTAKPAAVAVATSPTASRNSIPSSAAMTGSPRPAKTFGTFMSSIFGGTNATSTMMNHETTTAEGSIATDKATTASSKEQQHNKDDRISEQRRVFDFETTPATPQSKRSVRSRKSTTPRSRRSSGTPGQQQDDDYSADDYEEIEVVHVDDDNQTTLSELEQKILYSEQQQQKVPTSIHSPMSANNDTTASSAYRNGSQAGFERIQMLLSEDVSEQQQLGHLVLSADLSSITASMRTTTQPSQLHAATSHATGMSPMAQVKEADEESVERDDAVTNDAAVNPASLATQPVTEESGPEKPNADDDDNHDDGSKCTVTVEHNFDVVELAHISEDEEEPLPTYDERRDIATKVLGTKMIQGFKLTELQCNKCLMPLMEKNSSYFCVVCPVLKKKFKESLASLGDDLTETSPKSRMQGSATSSSRMQSSASASDAAHSSGGDSGKLGARSGPTANKLAGEQIDEKRQPLADSSIKASESGSKASTLPAISAVRSGIPTSRPTGLAAIQEHPSSTIASIQSKATAEDPAKNELTVERTGKEVLSLKKESTNQSRASSQHSMPRDIHTALSPKSAISKLTSVGSASQYSSALAPVRVPKTVSTPSTRAQGTGDKPLPDKRTTSASISNNSRRYLTPTKESKIPWDSLRVSTSPTQSTVQAVQKLETPGDQDQHPSLLQQADVSSQNSAERMCISTVQEVKTEHMVTHTRRRNDEMSTSDSKHTEAEDSQATNNSYDTVPEHLLELRRLNQSVDISTKLRPDAPANTLVRSVKSGLVLPSPLSEEVHDSGPVGDSKTDNEVLSADMSMDGTIPTREFSVVLPKHQKDARAKAIETKTDHQVAKKTDMRSNMIASKAAQEMKKRRGVLEDSSSVQSNESNDDVSGKHDRRVDASIGGSSKSNNHVDASCVSLLSEDIKTIQTVATSALMKTDREVTPCLQDAIHQLVINPFAQLEDGYNDYRSLSPPSRQKRKELEKQAAVLLAEAEAAASKAMVGKTPAELQDHLETALVRENERAQQESIRLKKLERQFDEQTLEEAKQGVLDDFSSHMKALFGEKERDLMGEISRSVKAREEAEAEARRLAAELHALKEERRLERLQNEADQQHNDDETESATRMLATESKSFESRFTTKGASGAVDDKSAIASKKDSIAPSAASLSTRTVQDELALAIAQGDASVVAEVESIVRSQAEDYHDLTDEASRVQEYWDTLRIEGRAIMTRRLMGGWILLKETCLGSHCEGRPLLLDDDDKKHCVVCGGSGNGLDGVYAIYLASGQSQVDGAMSPPREINTPKAELGTVPTMSYLDEISHDLGVHVMKTVWTGPSEIKVEDYEAKRDFVSKEIGKRMLKGWTLLQVSCPQCTMPLMTDLDKRKEICVLCGVVGLAARSSGSIVSLSTSRDNMSLAKSARPITLRKSHRLGTGESMDGMSRISTKKDMVRQLVINETRKATASLQDKNKQAPGDRCDSISNSSTIDTSRQETRSLEPSATGSQRLAQLWNSGVEASSAESVGRSSVPEWLAPGRRTKDASISPARSRVAHSTSGRISIDPSDTSAQRSLPSINWGKENSSKRVDARPDGMDQASLIHSAMGGAIQSKPVLSPVNKSAREIRSDPPAMQGYAVGRKKAVDADATNSTMAHEKESTAYPSSPTANSHVSDELQSPTSQVMTLEIPRNFDPDDEASIIELMETVTTRSLTVDTSTRRSGVTRAEPSPGMSQLMLPGSKGTSAYHVRAGTYQTAQNLPTIECWNSDHPTSKVDAGDGRESKAETLSLRTRALASPGLPSVNNFEHCESPGRSSSSDDISEPPARFEHPVSFKKKTYKSTDEMKKALRGTNSFLARKPASTRHSSGRTAEQRLQADSSDRSPGSEQKSFLKKLMHCGPANDVQVIESHQGSRTERSVMSSSSRPRITPESTERQNLGGHRPSMSSSSGDARAISGKASGSTKLSSLTPDTTSSHEISGVSSRYLQMSPAFSVDQITIPAVDESGPSEMQVFSSNSQDLSPRATSAKADDGDEPLNMQMEGVGDIEYGTEEVTEERFENEPVIMHIEPPTPINLTMTSCMQSMRPRNKQEIIVLGGPLDLTNVPDEDVYDVTGMHPEEHDDVYEGDDMFDMSEIRDEDIFGSQYHARQHPDLSSFGSSTLDAVLARIDATKRQLEEAPSGDSDRLRQLIENLAEAASDIEKEDLRDQTSRRSEMAGTPQQKSQYMCN